MFFISRLSSSVNDWTVDENMLLILVTSIIKGVICLGICPGVAPKSRVNGVWTCSAFFDMWM